jgi:hypothetical protein
MAIFGSKSEWIDEDVQLENEIIDIEDRTTERVLVHILDALFDKYEYDVKKILKERYKMIPITSMYIKDTPCDKDVCSCGDSFKCKDVPNKTNVMTASKEHFVFDTK